MSISRRTVASILILAFKAVCIIEVNRSIAGMFGPDGFAEYAHFLNALSLFLLIPSEGIGRAIVKYLSDPLVEDKNRFIAAGWVLHVAAILISAVVILVFPSFFLGRAFPGFEERHQLLPYVFILVVYGHMTALYMQSVLLGLDRFKEYSIWQYLSAALPLLWVLFVPRIGYGMQLFIVGSLSALMAVPAHIMIFSWSGWKGLGRAFSDLIAGKIFLRWVLVAFVAVLSGKGVEFIMRSHSIDLYGTQYTGLWQSVVRFSDYYMAAFYGLVTMVYYPRLSALVNDSAVFKKTFLLITAIVMLVSVVGLVIIYQGRMLVLEYFFSDEFLDAYHFFGWQLIGDGVRILSVLCGIILLIKERLLTYTVLQLVYGAATIFWIYMEEGAGSGKEYIQATAFAAIVYCALTIYMVRKELRS